MGVEIARSRDAVSKIAYNPAVSLPERSHRVAIAIVPLRPTHGEVSHLVTAFSQIPGFGDQFHLREHRILMNDVEKCPEPVDFMQFAGKRGGKVEAEAIHVHLQSPVAQAVHDQLENARMLHIQRVSSSRIIRVVARIIGDEAVVGAVIDALEREGRTHLIAFRRVVVNHVQNHLQAGGVQRLHHGLEFSDRTRRQVTRLERKKADGVISPIVSQAAFHQLTIVHKTMHGHEFDRSHSQPRQVFDHRCGSQCRVGPAQMRRNIRMTLGESLDVHFVDQGLMPRNIRPRVRPPGKSGVNDAVLRHSRGIVTAVKGQIFLLMSNPISKMRVVPVNRSQYLLAVRIKDKFVGIESMALKRSIWPKDAVSVQLPGTNLRKIPVPNHVGLLGKRDAPNFTFPRNVEKAEVNLLGMFRVESEVNALTVPGCAQRIGPPRPDDGLISHLPPQAYTRGGTVTRRMQGYAKAAWIVVPQSVRIKLRRNCALPYESPPRPRMPGILDLRGAAAR